MRTIKKWLSTAAVVFVGTICFVGAQQLTSGGASFAQRALTPTAEIERMLDELASTDPMLSALSGAFPVEWLSMRAELANDIKSNISNSEVKRRAHFRSRAFMLERAPYTAAAPTASLVAVAKAEALLISQLQIENVQVCADFAKRGIQPEAKLSQPVISLIGRAVSARVFATRKGIDGPVSRQAASDGDWDAVITAMESQGATSDLLQTFTNPAIATIEQQCSGGVYLYIAVASLPAEQAARVFADMTIEAAKNAVSQAAG